MIYGYLRVSSDEQDVNSQRQGVEQFATDHGWSIDNYITDEGVSGGKDPDKRNLGPLLKQIKKGDVIICSEISRLGRAYTWLWIFFISVWNRDVLFIR